MNEHGRDGALPRVLIVDDEQLLIRALKRMLEREFSVTAAADPAAALELVAREPWDAVLTDLMMDGMNGVELARRAVLVKPELRGRILVMTGGAPTPGAREDIEGSGLPVVEKPIDIGTLRATLRRACAGGS